MNQPPTRERLLGATRRLVRDHGLAGATSRSITADAETNLGAITYHFGSKDDLIGEALLNEIRARLDPAMAVLRRTDLDPATRMLETINVLRQSFAEAVDDAPTYVEALVSSRHIPALQTGIRSLFDELRASFTDQIASQQADGQLPAWIDAPAMASLLIAVANGIVMQSVLDPSTPDVGLLAAQFAGLLLAARNG